MTSIANNEPTNEKVSTTKTFAHECTVVLKMSSKCTLSFDKFMHLYLQHFGRQCRLADYGPFNKLKNLFESIPATIEIKEDVNGERVIHLMDCVCKNSTVSAMIQAETAKIESNGAAPDDFDNQAGIYILQKIRNYANFKIRNRKTLPKLNIGIYSKFGQYYRYNITMYDFIHIIQFLIPIWSWISKMMLENETFFHFSFEMLLRLHSYLNLL